jgi:SAM-dependent methyltransferase
MSNADNYIAINKQSWNNKVDIHIASDFYEQEAFLKGQSSLNDIELNLLGNIAGKKILHLQCHFGQDTISLSRLGAHATGVDLSDKAIERANEIALQTNTIAHFICCNVYDLPKHLNESFDIVFTSYGTIGWLPDLHKWAEVVSHFLKPGGQFVIVEFHPVVWMFDDNFTTIGYNYFNSGPITETETGTYANKEADIKQDYIMWNHSMSEIINSLIQHGLHIESFNEFDYSPYNCFNKTVEVAPKKYRIEHLGSKIPMVFAISAVKR